MVCGKEWKLKSHRECYGADLGPTKGNSTKQQISTSSCCLVLLLPVCVCVCVCVLRLLCMTGRIRQIPIVNACHILLQMDSDLHCDLLFVCVLVFIPLWVHKSLHSYITMTHLPLCSTEMVPIRWTIQLDFWVKIRVKASVRFFGVLTL